MFALELHPKSTEGMEEEEYKKSVLLAEGEQKAIVVLIESNRKMVFKWKDITAMWAIDGVIFFC